MELLAWILQTDNLKAVSISLENLCCNKKTFFNKLDAVSPVLKIYVLLTADRNLSTNQWVRFALIWFND